MQQEDNKMTTAGQNNVRQTDQQGNIQEQTGNNVVQITTNIRLWHYLFKEEKAGKQQGKLTKAQAFYDLLAKQQLAEVTEDPDWINRGFLQLANAWKWNREAVTNFISKLVAEKAAQTFSYTGKTIVILTNIKGLNGNTIQRMTQNAKCRTRSSDQNPRIFPGTASPTLGVDDADLNPSEV